MRPEKVPPQSLTPQTRQELPAWVHEHLRLPAHLERDLQMKQQEMTAVMYKEIQGMVAAVARQRKMTLVIAAFREEVSANNVTAAAAHQVVYAAPEADITEEVTDYLNRWYEKSKAANGTAPAAAAPAPTASGALNTGK